MTTFFCNFCQFSVKKLAFFLKNQCHDQTFAITSSSLSKKCQKLGETIFKTITLILGDRRDRGARGSRQRSQLPGASD
jgi:hypothetical protein